MTTLNGKNKVERQINKAKKYLGIELVRASNKYLNIESVDSNKKYYFVSPTSCLVVKNGELLMVKPLNKKDEKPFFFKTFAVLKTSEYFNGGGFIVSPFWSDVKKEMSNLSKGFDDIVPLNLKNLNEYKIKIGENVIEWNNFNKEKWWIRSEILYS